MDQNWRTAQLPKSCQSSSSCKSRISNPRLSRICQAFITELDYSKLDSVRNFKFTQDESKIARHAIQLHSLRGRQGRRHQPQECCSRGRHSKLAHRTAALPAQATHSKTEPKPRHGPPLKQEPQKFNRHHHRTLNTTSLTIKRRNVAVAVRQAISVYSHHSRPIEPQRDGEQHCISSRKPVAWKIRAHPLRP